jgi:hypothetical protein
MTDEERRVYDKTHWLLNQSENLLGELPDPDFIVPFCRSLAHELVQLEVEYE